MNNILKRTVSSVLAFTVALSSVQLYGTTAHAAVASGVKGDANADGVVTEADLDIYESYLLGNTEIADDILEDMDIDYDVLYSYVYVNGNDYAAVRNYLEGCTQTIEPSGHIDYKNDGGILSTTLYAGYYLSEAVFIAEIDNLTNSVTEHEITEIIWDGGKPDWATEVEIEGEPYIEGTPDETDVGTYNMLIVGKSLSGKYHAIANRVEVCLPDYKATTEDGNIFYEEGTCILAGPGTYNITTTAADVTDMIMIADIGQPGKCVINLNGMNINCGNADNPGDFIKTESYTSDDPAMDIDIMLSGSNVMRNADVNLYTEGQVNIYGDDDDTLSLLGNSSVSARAIKVNGGKVTVKSNYYQAMKAEQLTMMGGSLDLSFSPIEGQQWGASHTTLTGVGLTCDEVIIRRGNLSLSGNNGALKGINSTPKFYVSPLYCDIDIETSDDGNTYTAIEGSPFSDPEHAPSASTYTNGTGAGAPDNSIDVSGYISNKNYIKIVTGHTYSYNVTINADEHSDIVYEDDKYSQKIFSVPGGEKLPEGISFLGKEGWEIDSVTASVNGGASVSVTDISDIVINADTVISVTSKDVKAPVINGVTNGSKYCGTVNFTVTDDSDVSVTIEGEPAQPDENGVYTIVGNISSYAIVATDAFGNETTCIITVYDSHAVPTSNCQDNGDGTHTGVCEYCNKDVSFSHTYDNWTNNHDTGKCERECPSCGHKETKDHDMSDWESEDGETHSRECNDCHCLENTVHVFGEWNDNHNTDMHEKECEDCGYIEEANHVYGEWTDNHESGKHERECETCGHIEEADHVYGEWTDNHETGKCERICATCGHSDKADHVYGMWTDNDETGRHERKCENCGHIEEAEHNMEEYSEYDTSDHIRYCIDCGSYYETESHIYGDWEEIVNTNNHKRECLICGHTEYDSHNYGNWTDNDETGKCERECEDCGRVQESEHDFGEWTDNHDTGKCEKVCANCGHKEEAEHAFGEWTDNHDTGKCEKVCANCGHKEEAEHAFGDWTDNHDTGKCEKVCANCGHKEEAEHDLGDWTDNHDTGKCEAECANCGHKEEAEHAFGEWTDNHDTGKCEKVCANCGHKEEAEHAFGDWTDNHDTGKCEAECANCGHKEEAEHAFGDWTDNHDTGKCEAECTNCGHKEEAEHALSDWTDNHDTGKCEKVCANCGHKEEAEHAFGEWTDNHDTGKCEAECANCGHKEEAEHAFGEWTDNHDTGKCEAECANCGHKEEAEHAFGEWTDNHDTGKCEKVCANCGHKEEAEHDYCDWHDTKDGKTHEHECKACKHTETQNHVFENIVASGNGQHKATCSKCGAVITEDCNGVWEIVKDATCTEEGKKEMVCDICGETHTEVIEKIPHEFVDGRCSSCFMEDPAISGDSANPPTGVTLGAGLAMIIPASALIFFARPKSKKNRK